MAPLHLLREDHARLRLLLSALPRSPGQTPGEKLRGELDRAILVDATAAPAGLVTLDSEVEFEDLGTGEVEQYTLTMPERADVASRRLSVLAPIGTALIGFRTGDVVDWPTPGGMRRLRIRRVN